MHARANSTIDAASPSLLPSPGVNVRRWLLAIIVLSAVVRLAHFAAIAPTPFIEFPIHADQTDMHGYWQWSGKIAAGDWLQRDTWHPLYGWMARHGDMATWLGWWGDDRVFHQEPAYPYAIAIGRSVGLGLRGVIFVQLMFGVLAPLLMFALARRVLRDPAAALLAAAAAGLYGPLVFNQGALLRDWTGPMLGTAALAALLIAAPRARPGAWLVPGVVLGFTLITHATVMLFLPFMFAWVIWTQRGSLRGLSARLGLLGLGMVIGFSPLLVRNLAVGAPPLKVTNRLPEVIATSSAADANPLGFTVPDSMPDILEAAQGSAWVAGVEALKTYQGDWAAFIDKHLLKLRAVFDPFEIPNNMAYFYGEQISPALRVLPDYSWLLPLCVLGIGLTFARRRVDRAHALVLLLGLSGVLALVATSVVGRYRLILLPPLCVYAGWALWQLGVWLNAKRYAPLAGGLAVVAVVVGLQQFVLPIAQVRHHAELQRHGLSYGVSAAVYQRRGEPEAALGQWALLHERSARLGLDENVDFAARRRQELLFQWMLHTAQPGRADRAADLLRRAEALYDHRADATFRDFDIGMAFARLGMADQAAPRLKRFVEQHPDRDEAALARRTLEQFDP